LLVVITEGIPPQDTAKLVALAKQKGVRMVGPNCPGVITPGETLLGILPGSIFKKGPVGMVSRSGTLTYEIALALTESDHGQSTCVGIGGDPVKGMEYPEVLTLFNNDPETEVIVMIGEIGGSAEEEAAEFIKKNVKKPVVGFIAGRTAPPGRRMGHAGAIISGGKGTAAEKMAAMKKAGIHVIESPAEIGVTMLKAIEKLKSRKPVVNKSTPVKKVVKSVTPVMVEKPKTKKKAEKKKEHKSKKHDKKSSKKKNKKK